MRCQKFFIVLFLTILIMPQAFAQTAVEGNESVVGNDTNPIHSDTVSKRSYRKLKKDYVNGRLDNPVEIIRLTQFLVIKDKWEDAANIITTEMNSGKLPRTAQNTFNAGSYFAATQNYPEALPYFKEAVELGHKTAQIQLAQAFTEIQYSKDDKRCDLIASEMYKAVAVGTKADHANIIIGNCHFRRAKDNMSPQCKNKITPNYALPDNVKTEIELSKAKLNIIPQSSEVGQQAKKWIDMYSNEKRLREYLCRSQK
ncbi:hypothetical protein [Hellea balneolensis]|uniref:hypothetical protein n=1 Tax=Hellea balneolensis TaxID=287478 RepID=UPI0003FBB2E1|nr:hypothetical protein [Hellea balneolensis]